jgi:hypothetical protein
VALSDQQLHDAAGACRAASFRPRSACGHRFSASGPRRLRHIVTSAALAAGGPRRSRRRCAPP